MNRKNTVVPFRSSEASQRRAEFTARCNDLAALCLSIDQGAHGLLPDLFEQIRLVCLSGARCQLAERKEAAR